MQKMAIFRDAKITYNMNPNLKNIAQYISNLQKTTTETLNYFKHYYTPKREIKVRKCSK